MRTGREQSKEQRRIRGKLMENLKSQLEGVGTVAIAGHVRPDGDCVGSCLAVYNYIKTYAPQIQVDLYLQPIPNIFKFLKNSEKIKSEYPQMPAYDLFIMLDCGDTARLGDAAVYFEEAKKTVCIDHHVSNTGFADKNYIFPKASSASELVFELIEEEKMTQRDRRVHLCRESCMIPEYSSIPAHPRKQWRSPESSWKWELILPLL